MKYDNDKKSLTLLGSTGSIGTQSLEVAEKNNIKINLLTAHANTSLMEKQARKFHPAVCVMSDESAAKELKIALRDTDIAVYGGSKAICDAIHQVNSDTVLNAIVGEAGLLPTLSALRTHARLALANKESLVCAGDLVMETARQTGSEIIPVDSEHSAIFQCLRTSQRKEVKRLWLTASGGPFFGYDSAKLKEVTLSQTLLHPTWKMGAKITVDSATMMNKGFEVIEAAKLFSVPASDISVIVHRESILHSAVEYIDSAVIAQMGTPDMRTCISYALTYPDRVPGLAQPLDLTQIGKLSFALPDYQNFPLLETAKRCAAEPGALTAVLNAANEVAVAAFLSEKIRFCDISETVIKTTDIMSTEARGIASLDEILQCSAKAREIAAKIIRR